MSKMPSAKSIERLRAMETDKLKVRLIAGTREPGIRTMDVWRCLDKEKPDIVIVGDANGVDEAVYDWCRAHRIGIVIGLANGEWPLAGPIRNQIDTLVLAGFRALGHDAEWRTFPHPIGGKNKGSNDMAKRCERLKLPGKRHIRKN